MSAISASVRPIASDRTYDLPSAPNRRLTFDANLHVLPALRWGCAVTMDK